MRVEVEFREAEKPFVMSFEKTARSFEPDFEDVIIVKRTDIPPEYGLITYDHNRTITVS